MLTITRAYALALGLAFILAGIGGFVPGVTTLPDAEAPNLLIDANYAYLLGLFPINLIHNLFHFTAGVFGILASHRQTWAQQYCRILGIILTIFTMMGMLPQLSTTLGLMPLFGHDIWLHGLEAAIALYLGFRWQVKPIQLQWGRS